MASDNTEQRRERVRQLWRRPDRKIAEQLIEEGFAGATPRTADGKRKQVASMARNVWNDRAWWRKQWRDRSRATTQDANESRGEYLARLDSLIEDGLEILEDTKLKGTPRVQALSEIRQLEQAKAKAIGVAETAGAPPEGDGGSSAPFLGIVVGLTNLTPEAKKKIDDWKRRKGD